MVNGPSYEVFCVFVVNIFRPTTNGVILVHPPFFARAHYILGGIELGSLHLFRLRSETDGVI